VGTNSWIRINLPGSGSDACFVPHEISTVHHLVECLDGREDLVKGALLQMVVVHTVQDNIHHIRQQLLYKHSSSMGLRYKVGPILFLCYINDFWKATSYYLLCLQMAPPV
jgi:hypothetical protein